MKKTNIIFFFLFCLGIYSVTFSQSGFFGKKNIVEVQAHGNITLIDGLFNFVFKGLNEQTYIEKKGDLIPKKDWFNYGFSIQNFHYFKKSTGFGLQVSYDFQNTNGPTTVTYFDPSLDDYSINHEMLKINTLTIMPKLEFSSFGTLLPSGLSHQVGLGYTITSIVKKDYLVESGNKYTTLNQDKAKAVLNDIYASKNYNGITFLYQMNYRTPLNKRLFLNWGMRYNLNICGLKEGNLSSTPSEIKRSIKLTRLTNVIQFTLGLGFTY